MKTYADGYQEGATAAFTTIADAIAKSIQEIRNQENDVPGTELAILVLQGVARSCKSGVATLSEIE